MGRAMVRIAPMAELRTLDSAGEAATGNQPIRVARTADCDVGGQATVAAARLLESFSRGSPGTPAESGWLLTERDEQVLITVAHGKTNAMTASSSTT